MIPLLRRIRVRFSQFYHADWLMILSLFVLLLFGLAAIYSVDLSRGIEFLNVKKQAFAILIALILAFFLATSNYKLLRNYSLVLYGSGIFFLLIVLWLGTTVRGSRGWFVFDWVSLQPVEFMKFALVVALSTYFSQRARKVFSFREFYESLAIVGIPIGLTLLQPDFGSAFVLMGIWVCVVLLAGIRARFFVPLVGFFGLLFYLGWKFFFADYQRARVLAFFNPQFDPLGQGYNVSQAIIAIGAGGWFGRGLGFGSQSQLKFLPESHTDFIFAVIAEELGFFGVLLLLGAFVLLFSRIMIRLWRSRDNFTAFLLVGIASTFFLQIFVNVSMNLGLFPVTGIGLPLVSYGGSSVMLFLAFAGVLQGIAMHTRISGDS